MATTTLICKRKYNKEEYKFFLIEPDYVGELGICGIPITPYVYVETPENGFGYSDTVFMDKDNGTAYTLHRYLPLWILKKIAKKMQNIMEVYYGI